MNKQGISFWLGCLSLAFFLGCSDREEVGSNADGAGDKAPTKFTNSIGMNLKLIPAGEFLMGSPEYEDHRNVDEQQHRVKITKSYYLSTTEVTQQQWSGVMETTPWKGKDNVKEGAGYPASHINWEDATEYCRKLSALEGKTYRLPTEAEWEYACRAGTTSKYSFDNEVSKLGEYAWYTENANYAGEEYPHSVGQKKANDFGMYDMHGNVWEWCSDWYGEDYYGQFSGQTVENLTGPAVGSSRVIRGGSWDVFAMHVRSSRRDCLTPDTRLNVVGFRVLCELN